MKIKHLLVILLCAVALFGIIYIPLHAGADKDSAVKGIDISQWNGTVDFNTMKNRGVDFTVLRCYSYWKPDTAFIRNYNAAVAAGMNVGAYVYMYATSEASAEKEAKAVISTLGGRKLDYPLFLDIEDKSLTKLGKTQITSLALKELKIFENAGYDVGIYSSWGFSVSYLDRSRLSDYHFWLARWTYSSSKYTCHFDVQTSKSAYKPNCTIWQFTEDGDGRYYGCSERKADLNYSYYDFAEKPNYKISYDPNDYKIPTSPLVYGGKHNESELRWIQAMLYNLDYRIAVGGEYSSYMKDIVSLFQAESEIPITGNVDAKTIATLTDIYYEKNYSFKIKYKSSKNSLNITGGTYPFFTNYRISNPGLKVPGFKLVGWKVKRASDSKWLAANGKWYKKGKLPGDYAVLPEGVSIRLNAEFCDSNKKKETIAFYAVWESAYTPAKTVYYKAKRYDIYNDKLTLSDAETAAKAKKVNLASVHDDDLIKALSSSLTADSYFVGASYTGGKLKWVDGTESNPPEGSSFTNKYVTLKNGRDGYYLSSLSETAKAGGFITVSKCPHNETTVKNAVAATCLRDGYTGDTCCKACKTILLKGKVIPKGGHSFGDYYAEKKATLTEDGIKAHKCSVCGIVKKSKVVRISTIELKDKILACTGEVKYPKAKVTKANGKTVSSKFISVVPASKSKVPGVYSVTIKLKGLYEAEKTLKYKLRPAKTRGLRATDVSRTQLTLTWRSSAGAKYYIVEKSVDGKTWTRVKTVAGESAKIKGLAKGSRCFFRVKSFDSSKKYAGEYSGVYETGTATAAPKIKLKNNPSSVTVTWSRVDKASGYIVYRRYTGGEWKRAGKTSNLSFNVSPLTKGSQVYIKVYAVNAYGKKSKASNKKSVVVGLSTPKVGDVKNGKISYSRGKYYITDSETKVRFILVNKSYSLPAGYAPGGLTRDCRSAFNRLVAGAKNDGITINALSAYRSYNRQKTLYNSYINNYGKAYADRISARPGHSEHQTGLAIDCNSLSTPFGSSPAGRWLRAHCAEYGFIIRYGYGKEGSTGYVYEPWHIRYIGSVTLAKKLTASGLSIEEYYGIKSAY